ncbi:MAG: hypothetical protein ACTTKL_00855 [Treponema sp.]
MAKAFKTFIACAVIAISFASTLFFIGWTQFKIKAGTVGVVVSKTGGVSPKIAKAGEFSWHWEFLIPTNAELKIFSVKPYDFSETVEGELPTAEILKNAFKDSPDFSYKFDFKITVSIIQDFLPELIQSAVVSDQDSLEKYIHSAAEEAAALAASYFLINKDAHIALRKDVDASAKLLDALGIAKKYPALLFTSFYAASAVVPDYKLYLRAQELYAPVLNDALRSGDKPTLTPTLDFDAEEKPQHSSSDKSLSEDDMRLLKKLLDSLR